MDEAPDLLAQLSEEQRAFLDRELGPIGVVADHSWPLQTTAVLEAQSRAGRVIIKAATGELTGHHLGREIAALRAWVPPGPGLPQLIAADEGARILVTAFQPGTLVDGTDWEWEPRVYRQAGSLLAQVHSARPARLDPDYEPHILERTLRLHVRAQELLSAPLWARAGHALRAIEPAPVRVVPTHGDMQPRNWLVDLSHPAPDGGPTVALIDFGRAERRPWYTDFVRVHHQQFVGHPGLRAAMWEGYGRPCEYPVRPTERSGWLLDNLLQALGTVVWATGVGELRFAELGRTMLARALDEM